MTELSKKEQLYELIRANPFISQQDLAAELGLSRSAVAGYIATLVRERRLLGRAYVLPDHRPILCVGAANLDRKLRANGTLVMGTSNPASGVESFGGVARNIAENLARMGAPVSLITAVGNDSSGRALLAHAESVGIDTRGTLKLDDAGSGTYTAVLDGEGQMLVALADMALYDRITPAFLDMRQQQRAGASLIVADLNLTMDAIATLQRDAARDSISVVLVAVSEPKMNRLPKSLAGVRLLILNEGELATRVGRDLPGEAELAAACREVQAQGAEDVVVTLGARGVLFTSGGAVERLQAPPAQVVDVTGAGDAFAAAVVLSLHSGGSDLALACRRGLQLSAMTIECRQTVCPQLAPETFGALN
ncbi:winged helix-turn-helix transcriptional regulator [Massilia sp. Dwa41.01b]|uniref:carbohydrate kinase n=1 Tax=unclassified Massilia TaxID=2609279 RepID=UPI001602C893|nr:MULTISPECIES: carbohydrate kinase [unclassified Massilia]QNA88104.1 winged helix-turn-helix transcriptional regulator [Massilia sp. Dwa41.01b]QNA99013.1 winged helix-turn-helix transcriptional regulator [Massilia sp. Se16.2.3]